MQPCISWASNSPMNSWLNIFVSPFFNVKTLQTLVYIDKTFSLSFY